LKVSDYIKSGILEEYCAGTLKRQQEHRILVLAKKYPAIQLEIEQIQETLHQHDTRNGVKPSRELKNLVLKQILANTPNNSIPEFDKDKELKKHKPLRKIVILQYATAAAITAFIISTAFSIYYNNQLKLVKAENIALKEGILKSEEQFASLEAKYLQYTSISENNEFYAIHLNGIGNYAQHYAKAYRGEQDIYLSISQLPKPPNDMQYQFWGIVDGTPVSAGLINPDINVNDLFKLKNLPNATAFAISLETIGGKELPTADKIFVLGEV